MTERRAGRPAPVYAIMGALLGATLLTGCGPSVGAYPIVEFTGRDALATIGQRPVAKLSAPKTAGIINEWGIEMAPLADAGNTPWSPIGRWESLFAEVAGRAQRKPKLTLSMACVAQEFGRVYMEHKAQPDESLRRFLIGGCGALVPNVVAWYIPWEAKPELKDEQVFEEMSGTLRSQLAKSLGSGADLAGFWFGRRDNQAVAYLVTADEKAEIKPFSLAPNAEGQVVIEGRLREEAQYFEALVNYGSVAVAPCEVDITAARPRFRFICQLASVDDNAWIQMLYAPPRRVLATVFAQAYARRSPDTPPNYKTLNYADPTPVKTPEEFTTAVLGHLNRVRAAAKLQAVTLAQSQTATAMRSAPHYFASVLGASQPQEADMIALGLLAGWEVQGMIRGGHLMSSIAPTMDAGRWLTAALETPLGRHTLFAPNIEQVAFGPMVFEDEGGLGSVVTGYRFHHGNDHADDVKWLLTRVIQARRRMGLEPPLRLAKVASVMQEELALVHQGDAMPRDALDRVLRRTVDSFRTPMQGFVIEAMSLDELEIPEEVLSEPKLHMDIGVTHHKAPGAAWAQYTILVVYARAS